MIKKHIPNFITCLNLMAGSMAVYYAFQSDYFTVLILVSVAAVFDFLDGFAARVLKAYSEIGKQLDSLADMVSFGLAPGALAFSLLLASDLPTWMAFLGFIIPIFSALRLAKFNIDTRQTTSFLGLPTPANAIVWIGFTYSYAHFATTNPWVVLVLIVVLSLLLVSELPMFSLKIVKVKDKQNITQIVFLAGAAALIGTFGFDGISLIIVWYIVMSLVKVIAKL